jgi:hypothetical protein
MLHYHMLPMHACNFFFQNGEVQIIVLKPDSWLCLGNDSGGLI